MEGGVGDHAAGFGDFYEADDRRERGAFDHLHHETDGRRDGDARGLWQHDEAQLLREREAKTLGRFPLALGHGVDAAAPNFGEVRARIQREADRCRDPR